MAKRRGRPSVRQSRSGRLEVVARVQHSWPIRFIGWLVRLRAEITLLVGFLLVHYLVLGGLFPKPLVSIIEVSAILLIALVPPVRRYVWHRMWCVFTRHRVRACFVQARVMTYEGKLPLFIWCRPSRVGERLRVWLPAGMSVKDIERVTDEIAVACQAREARITVNRKNASWIVIDVIRRDPFAKTSMVTPDVVDQLPEPVIATGEVVPLPRREDVITDTTPQLETPLAPPSSAPGWNGGKSRKAATSSTESTAPDPVVGFGGMDVSDYVD